MALAYYAGACHWQRGDGCSLDINLALCCYRNSIQLSIITQRPFISVHDERGLRCWNWQMWNKLDSFMPIPDWEFVGNARCIVGECINRLCWLWLNGAYTRTCIPLQTGLIIIIMMMMQAVMWTFISSHTIMQIIQLIAWLNWIIQLNVWHTATLAYGQTPIAISSPC